MKIVKPLDDITGIGRLIHSFVRGIKIPTPLDKRISNNIEMPIHENIKNLLIYSDSTIIYLKKDPNTLRK